MKMADDNVVKYILNNEKKIEKYLLKNGIDRDSAKKKIRDFVNELFIWRDLNDELSKIIENRKAITIKDVVKGAVLSTLLSFSIYTSSYPSESPLLISPYFIFEKTFMSRQ